MEVQKHDWQSVYRAWDVSEPRTERDQHDMVRLLRRTEVMRDPDSCWFWRGGRHHPMPHISYGMFGFFRSTQRASAHRVSYTLFHGDIPRGMQINHLCRVTLCVNPRHLELVTQRENLLRGNTVAARNAAKTICKNGHPLADNRRCPTCNRESQARFRAKHVKPVE